MTATCLARQCASDQKLIQAHHRRCSAAPPDHVVLSPPLGYKGPQTKKSWLVDFNLIHVCHSAVNNVQVTKIKFKPTNLDARPCSLKLKGSLTQVGPASKI